MKIPNRDGQVVDFTASGNPNVSPRIYFVNGIRVTSQEHSRTACFLSLITEQTVFGVFNATSGKLSGYVFDVLQSKDDWFSVFRSKLAEYFGLYSDDSFLRRVPPEQLAAYAEIDLRRRNMATASLFHELWTNRGTRQYIVAHSQGDLITADALWAMVFAFGDSSLRQIHVYSLASPAPAWPLAIRKSLGGGGRKLYGHQNDLITLLDPHNWQGGKHGRIAGDWRTYGDGKLQIGRAHAFEELVRLTNFSNSIRSDLHNLSPLTDEQVAAALKQAMQLVS